RALQLDGEYTAIAIAPDALRATLPDLIAQGYRGLNVTIPYKQAVMPLLDELSDAARAIGAVNTIVVSDGKLIGHNTDAMGFMRGLEASGDAEIRHSALGTQHSALVLGAGGAARAVVYALIQAGARVTIWNRTRDRAIQLAREFDARAIDDLPRDTTFDLIVNSTAVGMTPHSDETPLPLRARGITARAVYDLVYNPRETMLLREARADGAQPIGGIEMLVQQGAEALHLWTGRDAPVDAMRAAIGGDR
ncbi:MAG: shikimate dehydrogenase, partial [Chloroflexota bacterium]